jgi:hypothetical protein
MPKPISIDLRKRVAAFVEEGHSRRAATVHFKVSVSFVVNLVKAYRTGALRPNPSGDAATPSLIRILSSFWSVWPRWRRSPCRSWRAILSGRLAFGPIPPRSRAGSSATVISGCGLGEYSLLLTGLP